MGSLGGEREGWFALPCAHLLISHELDGGLWNDLDDVDAVPSPERPDPALPDHVGEAPRDAHAVAFGGVHLGGRGSIILTFLSFVVGFCTTQIYIHSVIVWLTTGPELLRNIYFLFSSNHELKDMFNQLLESVFLLKRTSPA